MTLKEESQIPEFELLGGPLHGLGRRVGLVRAGTNTVWLGVVLALAAWGVLMVLALLQGVGLKIFSLSVVGGHVRLLVAIPLFFLCETWVVPRMAEFVHEIVRSGMVLETEAPDLASLIRRVGRLKDSWLAEVLFLLIAFALPLAVPFTALSGRTGNWSAVLDQAGGRLTWVNGWYLWICLPLFRFLLLRWLWRLGLWCYFLRRLANRHLRLVPTHPDGEGGLGFLEIVHEHFTPLAFSISAILSASFAESLSTGTMAFEALYRMIPMTLLLVTALFIGPLLLFSTKLWRCRITGWSAYMAMASRYVEAFDRKWIRNGTASGDDQLGTADLQSLADLTNSVNVVRDMRLIPAGQRLVLALAASVMLPMLPLILFKYPIDQVAMRLFETLTGL